MNEHQDLADEVPSNYVIEGGKPAHGSVRCYGAKNLASKALIASLLTNEKSILTNMPPIGDLDITRRMLTQLGVETIIDGNSSLVVTPSKLDDTSIGMPHSASNRSPILLLSALLARHKRVDVPLLGGCNIGERNIDFHLRAIEAFGGEVFETSVGFTAKRSGRLQGTIFELPYPSVGATETCLFLAVLAEGRSVLRNIAQEPEIAALISMLRSMGAVIYTGPEREITIEGQQELRGTKMEMIGDRIEAASWASLALASGGEVTVKGIRPDDLGNFLSHVEAIGGGVAIEGTEALRFWRRRPLRRAAIETDVWPGFSTDWQQPFMIALSQAGGISVVHETVYEDRLGYLDVLSDRGAEVEVYDTCLGASGGRCRYKSAQFPHSGIVVGPAKLRSCGEIVIPDLRAGLAYVIAAAVAEGTTRISGLHHLHRGYGEVSDKLRGLGVDVEVEV